MNQLKIKNVNCGHQFVAKTIIASVLLASPCYALAYTKVKLDYRHEYKDESKQRADRLKTFITTDSVLFEIEARATSGSAWMKDQTISTYDIGIFYPFRLNENLVVIPGLDYIIATSNQQYVPSLRLNYKTDNGIRLATRYKQVINEKAAPTQDDQSHIQRVDFWLGYGNPTWDIQYQVSFGKELNNSQMLQDNKDTDYWQNIRLRYQSNENWKPYIELGDVKVSSTTDERQIRYRVGIQYAF